jgi:hypothetical protein
MKPIQLVVALALGVGLVACSKQESQTPASTAQPAAENIQKQAEAAAPAAQSAVAATASQAQGLISKVQGYIADSKYSDAANVLKELSSMKLTPEQQKLVDDLTAQVQKAMAGAAASDASKKATDAVGGMLGK